MLIDATYHSAVDWSIKIIQAQQISIKNNCYQMYDRGSQGFLFVEVLITQKSFTSMVDLGF